MMIILSHFYGQLLPSLPSLLCMNHSRVEEMSRGTREPCECPESIHLCVCLRRESPPTLLNICLPPAQPHDCRLPALGYFAPFYINGSSLNCWHRFHQQRGQERKLARCVGCRGTCVGFRTYRIFCLLT